MPQKLFNSIGLLHFLFTPLETKSLTEFTAKDYVSTVCFLKVVTKVSKNKFLKHARLNM
jgi:hypothetical protein